MSIQKRSRAFDAGHRIVGVARSAEAASLGLIESVDGTVDSMVGLGSVMSGLARMLMGFVEQTETDEVAEGQYIDPDDEAINLLAQAEANLKDLLTVLTIKRGAINKDARLADHHCEALHDAYEQACTAVAELIEACQSARATVITHDMKAEPRNAESFATVDALISNLRSA